MVGIREWSVAKHKQLLLYGWAVRFGNSISVNNGKNGHTYVCPSLVTIL